MPTITQAQLKQHKQYLSSLENERSPWEKLWRELSDNFLPQRYRWLMSPREWTAQRARRQYIINNTGTNAARTLAAGMMNGITSPARPWFKLRAAGVDRADYKPLAIWLEEVERTLLRIMAESNFYNSMAVMYLDMAVFGTAANLIYEDYDNVIRCYNPPMGEYFLANDHRYMPGVFARKFYVKAHQYIQRWPDRRYWSDRVKNIVAQHENGSGNLNEDIEIAHFIGPNHSGMMPARFRYYELYFEARRQTMAEGYVLEKRGYYELPGIFGRWETSGTDPYGVGPGMDALGDTIELQHLHRNKAEILEKVHNPAMVVDIMLQNNPVATMPKGVTFVAGLNSGTVGAKPIHTIPNPHFAEIAQDKLQIEERIRNSFYNFLFTGITNLQTVRAAAEIEARESEKLILLGGVLERFESEALDPAIKRIYSIADRAGLIPPRPQGFEDLPLEIQYVSILSVAQRAVGTAPTERWLGLTGQLAALRPDVMDLTKFDNLLTGYARDIGIRESDLNSPEEVTQIRAQRQAQQATQDLTQAAPGMAQAAKTLSETDVGGGANALQQLMGGGG